MARKNAFLEKQKEREELLCAYQREFTIRQCRDMMLIAANTAFGFGEERLKRLLDAYDDVFIEYAEMAIADGRTDADIDYTKGKLDGHLERIMGKHFEPWEKRYQIDNHSCYSHTYRGVKK